MNFHLPFADVLEAVDRLSSEEQETLLEIVHRRIVERGRKRLAEEAKEARQEFVDGVCRPVHTDQLMDEILS